MVEVHVGDALAITVIERFKLGSAQDLAKIVVGHCAQARPHRLLRQRHVAERAAVGIGNGEEALQEFLRIGPPPDGEEVDDLDEQARLASARFADRIDDAAQTRKIAIVADTQQRTARNVADARGFDHDGAGPPARESLIPCHHLIGRKAVLRGAPRHHGRYPAALPKRDRADLHRRKQPRTAGFLL